MEMSVELKPEQLTVTIKDGPVHVLHWPGDTTKPSFHFAHANGFNAGTYRKLLAPLAGQFPIFASDLRGHGLTDLPADPAEHADWQIYGRDVRQLLDTLNQRAWVLAGHSMGAVASTLAAAADPARVRGLLLLEPVTFPSVWRMVRGVQRALGRSLDNPMARMTMRRRETFPDRDMAFRAYKGRGAFRTWPDAMLRDYIDHGLEDQPDGSVKLHCEPAWEAANYRAGPPPLADALRKLTCPITVMYGTERSTTFVGELRTMKRAARQLHAIRIEGASHFLPKEHPDRVRDEILRLMGL